MNSYRVVQLLYQTDADLFDAIQEWKERHPDLWVDDAIDAFGRILSIVYVFIDLSFMYGKNFLNNHCFIL